MDIASIETSMRKSWELLRQDRAEEALELLSQTEDSDEARALRIVALYRKQAWSDALACPAPEAAGYWQALSLVLLAVCNLRQGKAESVRPLLADAWKNGKISRRELMQIYAALMRVLHMEGEARLLKWSALDWEDPALSKMGMLIESKRFEEALQLAAENPDRAEMQLYACFALSASGKGDEAEAKLAALRDGADESIKPLFDETQAQLLLLHGKAEESAQLLAARGSSGGLAGLQALAQLGRREEAIAQAGRLVEGANAEAKLEIAGALMQVQAYSEAAALLEDCLKACADEELSARMKYALAKALMQGGQAREGRIRYGELIDELRSLYRERPERIGYQVLLGKCYRDMGLAQQAKEVYDFLKIALNGDEKVESLGLV